MFQIILIEVMSIKRRYGCSSRAWVCVGSRWHCLCFEDKTFHIAMGFLPTDPTQICVLYATCLIQSVEALTLEGVKNEHQIGIKSVIALCDMRASFVPWRQVSLRRIAGFDVLRLCLVVESAFSDAVKWTTVCHKEQHCEVEMHLTINRLERCI